jgi:hypothetical protein
MVLKDTKLDIKPNSLENGKSKFKKLIALSIARCVMHKSASSPCWASPQGGGGVNIEIGQGFIYTKQELNVDGGTLPCTLACSRACSWPPDKEEEACLLHSDRGTLSAWTCVLADASRLPLEEDKVEAYTLLPASRGLPPSLPPFPAPLCTLFSFESLL